MALTVVGAAGTGAVVVGLPGSALAGDNRYSLTAQGDAMFFQLDGEDIPASPTNEAGSLTAHSDADSEGNSTAFAGAPYYGKTAQTLPGTINGVPNQFGAPQLQLPVSQFPGYVTSSYPSQPKAEDAQGYYKVDATSDDTSSTASGTNGAPSSVPAPNQQQSVTAVTKLNPDGSTTAQAEGSAAGFVYQAFELGNSDAKALISDKGGKPQVTSAVFGRFSVGGQEFGFDKNGFQYLGQDMSQKDAVQKANDTLKAANMQIDVAPQTQETDPVSGVTTYSIGGLKLTTTQKSPSGAVYTIGYILGRAKVSSVNVPLGTAVTGADSTSNGPTLGGVNSAANTSPNTGTAASAAGDAGIAAVDASGGAVDTGAVDTTGAGAAGSTLAAGAPQAVVAPALPRTLGFVPAVEARNPKPGSSDGLYLMLVIAGLGVLAAQQLFSRFGVRMMMARK
ncbi:MAG TPA: hypothetical protein VGJ14_07940 [Sporichthyaceae bacterium]